MGVLYAIVFWLLWVGLPFSWIGWRHRSWVRGLTVAALVVVVPFGVTLALTACGGPAHWADAAAIDSWVSRCVNIGAPLGYLLGILLSLAGFRYRDRGSDRPREFRSLLHHRRGDRVAVGPCAGIGPKAGVPTLLARTPKLRHCD